MNIRHMLASATMLAAFVATSVAAAEFTILHHFSSSSVGGRTPYAGLTIDAAGNLYGTTEVVPPYWTGLRLS